MNENNDTDDIFQIVKNRMKRMFDEMYQAPLCELRGVVKPGGVSGVKFEEAESWRLHIDLIAWRINSEPIQISPLTIHNYVTEIELKKYKSEIPDYSVIGLTSRVVVESEFGTRIGLLVKMHGVDSSDQELNEVAIKLQEPVTYQDPIFGVLTLNPRIDWYSGKVDWLGNQISLNIPSAESVKFQNTIKTAHTLLENAESWNQRVRDFAVAELLSLKNENWLDEDELELSASEFCDRMTLESILIQADGSFEFWHNDGDLFFGHSIQVSGNLTDGPTDADIQG